MKFLDFLEGTLLVLAIGIIIGMSMLAVKYDDRTYSMAVSYAKEIDRNHFGGETNIERVIPGVYKISHKDGKIESLAKGYTEELSDYVIFMMPALEDLSESIN